MQDLHDWWQRRTKGERALANVACLLFILLAGIDIGRALHQATH
jgi:hypothetical protein